MSHQLESCVFYKSFLDSINILPETNQLTLYKAIINYSLTGIVPELEGIDKALFISFKPSIDSNIKRRLTAIENGKKGAEHGNKGGRPKNEEQTDNAVGSIKSPNNPQITPTEPPNNPELTGSKPLYEDVYVYEDVYEAEAEAENVSEDISGKPELSKKDDQIVFEYWQLIMSTHKSNFLADRKRIISRALKNYSVEECKQAILGCSKSRFYMGENPQKAKYNQLSNIFKNSDRIEQFIAESQTLKHPSESIHEPYVAKQVPNF